MRITADTNILIRVLTEDDAQQSEAAQAELRGADLVALPMTALCELAWVVTRGYRFDRPTLAETIVRLTAAPNVVVDRAAVSAGLAVLAMGGDFADGVIAYEGQRLGGETFVSFDQAAVTQLSTLGVAARRPDMSRASPA